VLRSVHNEHIGICGEISVVRRAFPTASDVKAGGVILRTRSRETEWPRNVETVAFRAARRFPEGARVGAHAQRRHSHLHRRQARREWAIAQLLRRIGRESRDPTAAIPVDPSARDLRPVASAQPLLTRLCRF
jgi:hypothetical protein